MRTFLVATIAIMLPTVAFAAMSSASFKVPSDSFNDGGGDTSTSANFGIRDTVGETAVGDGSSATFAVEHGYRVRAPGILAIAIVDAGGTVVPSPSVNFTGFVQSGSDQASTGTLGTSTQKIRITNTRFTVPWTVAMAATSGPTALWTSGGNNFDFNDASTTDGADPDAFGGKMTVDPTPSTIVGQNATCTTVGITKGPSTAFLEGTTNSITLLTASGAAKTNCVWDLTGVSVTQDVPGGTAAGSYSIGMTLTIS